MCHLGKRERPTNINSIEQVEKRGDRKSTRLNSSHGYISYAVFWLKKKTQDAPGRATVVVVALALLRRVSGAVVRAGRWVLAACPPRDASVAVLGVRSVGRPATRFQ